MTTCCICGDPCPGWDWRDTAWCAACYADHIKPGLLGLVREAEPEPRLLPEHRTQLDRWREALGVETGDGREADG